MDSLKMQTQRACYRIELLENGVATGSSLDHKGRSHAEAYADAAVRIETLYPGRNITWRLITPQGHLFKPLRLKADLRRVEDEKRDVVFFAQRRADEIANRAKTERLRALRLGRGAEVHKE
jgi:hypothetical protein